MAAAASFIITLLRRCFLPAFNNPFLRELADSALCPIFGEKIAMTTDSFVVNPRFFPGGDIGRLAVCGTVNDLGYERGQAAIFDRRHDY